MNTSLVSPDTSTAATVDAAALRALLAGSDEIAVIDARDGNRHSLDGHILRSISLPLAQLETRAAELLPRLGVPVVVYDAGDGVYARPAAAQLQILGYTDVRILLDGVHGWRKHGGEVFTGSYAIGKAFGEYIEQVCDTPHLSAVETRRRLEAGENIVLLDSRPESEFLDFSIPGAIDAPGAELVYRFKAAVPDPDTLVVVNCAGRTRGIIGAQALRNAGVPNAVASLANGTMDWITAGYALQSGKAQLAPTPTGDALAAARSAASHLHQRYGLTTIDHAALADFQHQAALGQRTLYLLDVRTRAEFEAGHVPGARWAPGGQLVQQLGDWIGVQNSRIVLVDGEDGARAAITASWLIQINLAEVFVLRSQPIGPLEVGPAPLRLATELPDVRRVAAHELQRWLAAGQATVIDIGSSRDHRAGHVPGSRFALRSQLLASLPELGPEGPIVVVSADGLLAAFAAADLGAATQRPVWVLDGGTAGWRASGLPLEKGVGQPLHPFYDVALRPYEFEDRPAAFRRYLDWELGLVAQLHRDGTTRFRLPNAPADASRAASA